MAGGNDKILKIKRKKGGKKLALPPGLLQSPSQSPSQTNFLA